MSKKILYKVTAYHCPKCGSVTSPEKKYCDYCDRDLAIRQKNKGGVRVIIDCGNFIYFDGIARIKENSLEEISFERSMEDGRLMRINQPPTYEFSIWLPATQRSAELLRLPYQGVRTIRYENLGMDIGCEMESYVGNASYEMPSHNEIATVQIDFISTSAPKTGGAIPSEVLEEMRCPNCGAPIKSRYGACDYCSGITEVEW